MMEGEGKGKHTLIMFRVGMKNTTTVFWRVYYKLFSNKINEMTWKEALFLSDLKKGQLRK